MIDGHVAIHLYISNATFEPFALVIVLEVKTTASRKITEVIRRIEMVRGRAFVDKVLESSDSRVR